MKTKKKISIVLFIIMVLSIIFPTSAFANSENLNDNNFENGIPYYFLRIDHVDVIDHSNGYYTLTIYPEGNFSYSFDGGLTWQKSNTATIYSEEETIEVAIRDSQTYMAYYIVDLIAKG